VDFDSNIYNVTFLPGAITSLIDISVTDDPLAELTENFTISISIPPQLLGIIPGDPSTATGFIIDDDGMIKFNCYIYFLFMPSVLLLHHNVT